MLPLAIIYLKRMLVLLASGNLREGYRKFHVDRMLDIGMAVKSFRPRWVPMLRKFAAYLNAGAPRRRR